MRLFKEIPCWRYSAFITTGCFCLEDLSNWKICSVLAGSASENNEKGRPAVFKKLLPAWDPGSFLFGSPSKRSPRHPAGIWHLSPAALYLPFRLSVAMAVSTSGANMPVSLQTGAEVRSSVFALLTTCCV